MHNLRAKQKGASAIVTVIILAILAYGIFLGIQCFPQAIESRAVDSIYSTIEKDHRLDPIESEVEVKDKVIKMLQVNELNELTRNVRVRRIGGTTTVKIKYERELNLGYKTKPMVYEKILVLK